MKKFLAIALALVLTLSLGVTAFAGDDVNPPEEPAAEGHAVNTDGPQPAAYTVTKNYDLTGGDVTPAETLEFEVALVSGVDGGVSALPTVGTNKDNKVAITSGETTEFEFPINFPEYSKVGVYTYTVTEKPGTVAGETYDDEPIYVVVTVTNANSGATEGDAASSDKLVTTVAVHKGSATGEKDAQFTNEYGMGSLEVTKQVTGKLASNTLAFDIVVTFTNENAASAISYTVADEEQNPLTFENGVATATISLSNGATATFTNIPAGTTYTVVENDYTGANPNESGTTKETNSWFYDDPMYAFSNEKKSISASDDPDTVTITNNKDTEIDTGISLDSLPYILIVAVILAASVVMVVSKRRSEV